MKTVDGGWIAFTSDPDGATIRTLSVFGASMAIFFPAYDQCQVDYMVRLRADKIENQ